MEGEDLLDTEVATVEVTAASIADDEEVLTADSTAFHEKLIPTFSGEEIIVLVNIARRSSRERQYRRS